MRLALSLELRPLPSTGITRLHQYYGPLRHPKAPGLSLAGVQLAIPGHAMRLPVLRALSLCTCCRHYPGAADGRRLRSLSQPYQPSPVRRPGRPARCPFRGLLGVHLRCGLHTRAATNSWHAIRRLQPFRYLHDCSGCFRRERVRRVGLAPTGKRRLVTAHVESGDRVLKFRSCTTPKSGNCRSLIAVKHAPLIPLALTK